MGLLTTLLGLLSTAMWVASLEPVYRAAYAEHEAALARERWLFEQCADERFAEQMALKPETAALCEAAAALFGHPTWAVALGACVPPMWRAGFAWLCDAAFQFRWVLLCAAAVLAFTTMWLLLPLYRANRDELECLQLLTVGRRRLLPACKGDLKLA